MDLKLNLNHALDFWGTKRTITHVWEGTKEWLFVSENALWAVIPYRYKLSTSSTLWFSLGSGD